MPTEMYVYVCVCMCICVCGFLSPLSPFAITSACPTHRFGSVRVRVCSGLMPHRRCIARWERRRLRKQRDDRNKQILAVLAEAKQVVASLASAKAMTRLRRHICTLDCCCEACSDPSLQRLCIRCVSCQILALLKPRFPFLIQADENENVDRAHMFNIVPPDKRDAESFSPRYGASKDHEVECDCPTGTHYCSHCWRCNLEPPSSGPRTPHSAHS